MNNQPRINNRFGPNPNSRFVGPGGYIRVHAPDHPRALKRPKHPPKYVLEHIIVAEKALGKFLPVGVVVHHVNRDRADNERQNLVICQDAAYHQLLHARQRVVDAGGDPNTEYPCASCRAVLPYEAFHRVKVNWTGRSWNCRECVNKAERSARLNTYGPRRLIVARDIRVAVNRFRFVLECGHDKEIHRRLPNAKSMLCEKCHCENSEECHE